MNPEPRPLPDARILHGFTTRGGIVWRNLAVAGRPRWQEHSAARLAHMETRLAAMSLERDENGATAAERGYVVRYHSPAPSTIGVLPPGVPPTVGNLVDAAALAVKHVEPTHLS